jgi:hypothetical protein
VLRTVHDRFYAIVEVEFDSPTEAEVFHESLHAPWSRVQGSIVQGPRTRIVEMVESGRC